jgi:hypothetical protein
VASLARRPRCDQESTIWTPSSGPIPGWLSSCGASLLISCSISRASSRSSTVSCWMRRASARRASSVPRSSGWRRCGRLAESRRSRRVRLSGRSTLRSGSGVVTSRSRSWQRPARFAFTARHGRPSTPAAPSVLRCCAASQAASARTHSERPGPRREHRSYRPSGAPVPAGRPRTPAHAARRGSGSGRPRTSLLPRSRTRAGPAHARRRPAMLARNGAVRGHARLEHHPPLRTSTTPIACTMRIDTNDEVQSSVPGCYSCACRR